MSNKINLNPHPGGRFISAEEVFLKKLQEKPKAIVLDLPEAQLTAAERTLLERVGQNDKDRSNPESPTKFFEKTDRVRFFCVENVNNWLIGNEISGKRWVKFLEGLAKVLTVVGALFSIGMPLAIAYLPAWVPWGIGLLLIIALVIAQIKLRMAIADYKQDNIFAPMLMGFLKQQTLKDLHPPGVWDLPKQDERLKSDKLKDHHWMTEGRYYKGHSKSAKALEGVLGKYDLEVTPKVQWMAAYDFANNKEAKEHWEDLKKNRSALASTYDNPPLFEQRKKELFYAAHRSGHRDYFNAEHHYHLDYHFTARDRVKATYSLIRECEKNHAEIALLYEEGCRLFAACSFLPEDARTFPSWESYRKFSEEIGAKLDPVVQLLRDASATEEDFARVAADIKTQHIEKSLYQLRDRIRLVEMGLRKWIYSHPQKKVEGLRAKFDRYEGKKVLKEELLKKKVEAVRARLEKYEKKKVLSQGQLQTLKEWVEAHPKEAAQPFTKLPKKVPFPEDIRWRLETKPFFNLRTLPISELLGKTFQVRQGFEAAVKEFLRLETALQGVNDIETYTHFNALWNAFQQNQLAPLHTVLAAQGEPSKTKKILSREQLQELIKWKNAHLEAAEKPIIELPESAHFPADIRLWLEAKGLRSLRGLSTVELLERTLTVREKFNAVLTEFKQLEEAVSNIKDAEGYAQFNARWNSFSENELIPLHKVIGTQGDPSKMKAILRAAFLKFPSKPFTREKIPEEPSFLRTRKIEEYRLNTLLKEVDEKMLFTNKARIFAIRVPIVILFVVESILAIYFATTPFFWAICGLTVVAEGAMQYIDYRLRLMDEKKQMHKMEHLLMNYPDIGVIPGTHPELAELKRVQQEYHLDRVRKTQAQILAKSGKTEKTTKAIAQKGKKITTEYLENRQAILDGQLRSNIHYTSALNMQAEINELQRISKRTSNEEERLTRLQSKLAIAKTKSAYKDADWQEARRGSIYKTLQRVPLTKETRQKTDDEIKQAELLEKYEPTLAPVVQKRLDLSARRLQVAQVLDAVRESRVWLTKKLVDYKLQSQEFEKIAQTLSQEFVDQQIDKLEIDAMILAIEGNHALPATGVVENITPILLEIKARLAFTGWTPDNLRMEMLAEFIERLKGVPVETLRDCASKMRTLQQLQTDPEYYSKANIDAKIAAIEQITPEETLRLKVENMNQVLQTLCKESKIDELIIDLTMKSRSLPEKWELQTLLEQAYLALTIEMQTVAEEELKIQLAKDAALERVKASTKKEKEKVPEASSFGTLPI